MPRDVLLFDLDGTLVDSAQGIAGALNRVRIERGGGPLPIEAVRPLVALGAEALVTRGLGALGTTLKEDLAVLRLHLAEVPADPRSIYPGVLDTLDVLAATGWRMAIVTNKPAALARKLLADLSLGDRFGAIVGGDTAAAPKPSPLPVRLALDLLRAEAPAALFVGDSAIDAGAAKACALPFLLFTGGYGATECAPADVGSRFERLADLPVLVQGYR